MSTIRRLLQFLPLLLLSVSVAGIDRSASWYTYAGSPEANASEAATLILRRLPLSEQSLTTAVNLCHKQNASHDFFCAWISVNDLDNDRPVAVSCFNEWHRQCNRRVEPLLKNADYSIRGKRYKYRQPECDLCTPCASGNWEICTTCKRVCYCTCAHSHGSSSDSRVSAGGGMSGLFQCNEFCDGHSQCDNRNDELSDSCDYYKLGGSPAPEMSQLESMQDTIIIVACAIILIGVVAITLYIKYSRYRAMMRLASQASPAGQPLIPMGQGLPPPSANYPRQDMQQPQASSGMPPPPSYGDAAK